MESRSATVTRLGPLTFTFRNLCQESSSCWRGSQGAGIVSREAAGVKEKSGVVLWMGDAGASHWRSPTSSRCCSKKRQLPEVCIES